MNFNKESIVPHRLSFQLYTARMFPPVADTLKMVAAIGFKEVEGFGGVYDDPSRLRAQLDRQGLTMPTGHFGLDMIEKEPKKALAIAKTLGVRHIFAPYVPAEERPKTETGWKKLGKRLAAASSWARGEGFGFGWHNHDFEFAKLPSGVTPHELIFDAVPMLDWECDVAWIARGGRNPIPWIKKYAANITAAHVKDIAPTGQNIDEEGWCDVGQGTVDWTGVFKALTSTRVLHYVLEHDKPKDVARFAKRSFDYVKKV